jgi:hypothetical protein
MHRATQARNAIAPLLDQLIVQLDAEGRASQRAYFARIRRSLLLARHEADLAAPIRELSTSAAVGFVFSNDADVLMSRILEKVDQLAGELEFSRPVIH